MEQKTALSETRALTSLDLKQELMLSSLNTLPIMYIVYIVTYLIVPNLVLNLYLYLYLGKNLSILTILYLPYLTCNGKEKLNICAM